MLFQPGNLTHNGHRPSLKMVMTMMLISVTVSLLVIFTELSEINALPSRGGGGLPSHGGIHPSGATPLYGSHPTGPGSIAAGAHPNGPGAQSRVNAGSNVINGPNGPHPNAPTVINGPNGPRVVNPNNPTTTAIVHPSNCPTVVHPNGADTTVVHPSNCPSSGGQVNVNSGGSGSSSSSSLTVNNVQQQSSSSGSTAKQQSSQSTVPIANAGSNMNVHSSDQVKLDGSKSHDPNGHSLSFSWVQLSGGPAVSLSKDNTAKPTFVAPKVTDMTGSTTLTFQLVVNNGKSDSSPSYVSVSVKPLIKS
jgi:hypothetical protein